MIVPPTPEELEVVSPLVDSYVERKHLVSGFLKSMLGHVEESVELRKYIHSMRSRLKDPEHLRDKLVRKLRASQQGGTAFEITSENLFEKINDLAGFRILHLHTSQVAAIDRCIKAIIAEEAVELIEGPAARTWDNEYRDYFKSIGIDTKDSDTLYTSVHYVLRSASKTAVTCEIQVRTLMEEVWGEVDHTINYPHPSDSVPCREQLRALARQTSSATRLVDAIFATVADIERSKA